MPMHDGKTVAVPFLPTPWRASLHQSKGGIPSRSIAGDEFIMRLTFSSSVRREQRSSARSRKLSDLSFQGSEAAKAPAAARKAAAAIICLIFISG